MKTGFFEESPGVKSLARLLSFMFAAYAIVISAYLFIKGSELGGVIAVFSAIAGFAVGLKLGQKPMEVKSADIKQSDPPDTPGGGN